ncbi:MAG: gamma-glutamyl-gamma-aminobutyrate hydrolase family protein [bacterium]|jgi:putative glutamine amidotransferase|nr:gamma-glutamyl-gamma-aminobutyrate hydrolase family protein [candidate division KSB1 bacterium]MDH7559054.1 gamma-glutamyl-gamma-aminobutyrate hydrolase family protein [bacterium]
MTGQEGEEKVEGSVHQRQEKQMAPIIGLTCDYSPVDDERAFSRGYDLYFVNCDYVRPLSDAGAAPMVLPSTSDPLLVATYVARIDGLLLTGGDDIDPEAYGERLLDLRWKTDRQRTVFEQALIAEARRAGMPIFGICRGCEAINVALGGSLYQDIPSMIPGALQHQAAGNPHGARHRVRINADSRIAQILGCVEAEVNSFHHQAIRRVAEGVRVVATAPDGVAEAIEVPKDFFTIAVQWHPERMRDDERQRALFAAFLDAVRQRMHARR